MSEFRLLRADHRFGSDCPARSTLVFDYHLLAKKLAHLLRRDARRHIDAAAGCEGHHQFDGSRWKIVLRLTALNANDRGADNERRYDETYFPH